MAKPPAEIFVCSNCDAQYPKWLGRCAECGQWGTIGKSTVSASVPRSAVNVPAGTVVKFSEVGGGDWQRLKTGIGEFDRVVGGGIVTGSLILLGGEPGIGKSTLVLQISQQIDGAVLYVSGEESAEQIKTRIDRLNIKTDHLHFLGETNVETIVATIVQQKPKLAIIDSIQTIYSSESPSGAGNLNQVRVCTTKLLEVAKKNGISIVIIGHVTKVGEVAGPKTLEHLVDVVLYLEGENFQAFRILRTAKNRFGSTAEVGIFEMRSEGLVEVSDPSAIFIHQKASVAGSIVMPIVEGSRVFLLEVQALVSPTSFGYPQRRADGFDLNRLQLLIATMTQRLGLKLGNQDIYLNVVGGLTVSEPAADLAVCLAIISAFKNKIIDTGTVAFGEVGLGGEIRPVQNMARRINEAEKLGFKNVLLPTTKEKIKAKSINLRLVKNLEEASHLLN